jgi:hypothetical protein
MREDRWYGLDKKYKIEPTKWWDDFSVFWKNLGKAHMEKVSPFLKGSDEEAPDGRVEYEILRAIAEGGKVVKVARV